MKPRILLIDDDQIILHLLRVYLELEGFMVLDLETISVDNLTDFCRKENPDIILMDVNLKQINGFTLLRALRQDTELRKIRVVMTSGMDLSRSCAQEGADAFLMKPYMPEDMVKLLKNNLTQTF